MEIKEYDANLIGKNYNYIRYFPYFAYQMEERERDREKGKNIKMNGNCYMKKIFAEKKDKNAIRGVCKYYILYISNSNLERGKY